VQRASLDAQGDVMLADVNHYRVNELQAADRTLQQIVQFYTQKARKQGTLPDGQNREALGEHHRPDHPGLPQQPRLSRAA
jgi:light-independent protochlorophyllide reductase subunit B